MPHQQFPTESMRKILFFLLLFSASFPSAFCQPTSPAEAERGLPFIRNFDLAAYLHLTPHFEHFRFLQDCTRARSIR